LVVRKFEDILANLQTEQANLLRKHSFEWYLEQIKQVSTSGTQQNQVSGRATAGRSDRLNRSLIEDATSRYYNTFNPNTYGKMVFFRYDPKHKKTLPYYDIYPLVIPLIPTKGAIHIKTMLGMNLHYLPPHERARLMSNLYTLTNTKNKLDEKTYIRARYQLLNASARFRYFKPCIKRYLLDHVKSRISLIRPEEWDKVLMLPVARFMKASEYKVWADSIRMINRRAK